MNSESITLISTLVIAIANIFLIVLIYAQIRHIYKPIITTKILGREKIPREVTERQQVLERGILYLVVGNISNNLASNLKIDYKFLLNNKKLIEVAENLAYLNPNEATDLILKMDKIIEKNPELFEKIEAEKTTKVIPKETLKLLLDICISYDGFFPKHEIKDSYEIEWASLKSYPDFKDHPIVNCWNKRGEFYIHKVDKND